MENLKVEGRGGDGEENCGDTNFRIKVTPLKAAARASDIRMAESRESRTEVERKIQPKIL